MKPTMTLAAIRANRPCEPGWRKLLVGLGYADGNYDPARIVSLGDVATANDAADAMWCVRVLDWSDIAVRRAVIAGAVMPAVRRAARHTTDSRVADAIDAIDRWCSGDDTVDLGKARATAEAAWMEAPQPAAASAWSATRAAVSASVRAEEAAGWAANAAATEEREHQRRDIITAFPPVALAKEHTP